ncbi:abscission/NoCut checkpoint regulator [Canis lupus baileyi]|uniref:Abscission/NoCut checkpoint regulator n=3 Tax=Canis lupus TaxID=9612 RepID=A0A8C0PDZ7_CANLF|nr:abscission/NoCut checkpoint regulator [Canis lupus familiaris]XP_025328946.1 abscission/NoCut checkpoint regulator [Canis lupus dingo]XP_038297926.1 abscission/NoCut checkpoint regulator [Canis lupus familiaris]XP_038436007.1 abscission/NoCut checkpoint regulator [Canis lupus familiaris]|eukprot:XP_003640089.1 abscission/NoCut checkpoint regulator [Canis lupus familiaris]
MESRCYGCAVKFTLFKKEYGCKNCGRAFCSGCLSFSAAVPRTGNTQQKVCKQCHEVLTRGSSPANASKWSPPQNYKKRVAALEAKRKPKTPQSQGLIQQDQVIAERLARLRQQNKPKSVASQAEIEARLAALRDDPQGSIPSTQEVEARLAALQGRVLPSQTSQLAHQPPDTRTQAQQAQDLLTQLAAEVAIDESSERGGPAASIQNDLNRGGPGGQSATSKGQATQSLEEEKSRLLAQAAIELREENTRQEKILALAKRLAVLRGQDPDKVTLQDYHLPDSDEDEDEETAIQRVLQQLTEEAALDEASGFNIPAEPAVRARAQSCRAEPEVKAVATRPEAEEEELPWCCICNEDATMRCADCDGDLYCARCFREGHDAFELKEHQTSAYCPPRAGREH